MIEKVQASSHALVTSQMPTIGAGMGSKSGPENSVMVSHVGEWQGLNHLSPPPASSHVYIGRKLELESEPGHELRHSTMGSQAVSYLLCPVPAPTVASFNEPVKSLVINEMYNMFWAQIRGRNWWFAERWLHREKCYNEF